MSPFAGEFIGTSLLIVLGQGVVANVVLDKSKGYNSGWIVISFGWAMGVYVGAYSSIGASDAHLNPAVTLMAATMGTFKWSLVPTYLLAQMLGAMTGSLFAYLAYNSHFSASKDADAKLAVFCTAPAIRKPLQNFLTELIATFVLILGVLCLNLPMHGPQAAPNIGPQPPTNLGPLTALPVSLLVLGIGLSLGGPTGYAINPARDLGPRIMHALLPIPGKRDSDWGYAWVPVLGPLAGSLLAVIVFKLLA